MTFNNTTSQQQQKKKRTKKDKKGKKKKKKYERDWTPGSLLFRMLVMDLIWFFFPFTLALLLYPLYGFPFPPNDTTPHVVHCCSLGFVHVSWKGSIWLSWNRFFTFHSLLFCLLGPSIVFHPLFRRVWFRLCEPYSESSIIEKKEKKIKEIPFLTFFPFFFFYSSPSSSTCRLPTFLTWDLGAVSSSYLKRRCPHVYVGGCMMFVSCPSLAPTLGRCPNQE